MTEEIINKIAEGKLDEAIKELSLILSKSKKLNEIIIQSSRYNNLKERIRLGTIKLEDATVSENQIAQAVLELVQDIQEAISKNESVNKKIHQPKTIEINQKHKGDGDNIGGNKIIINH